MFNEILGLLIDSQGNYLSFGKWDSEYSTKEDAYLFTHGRAVMTQIYFHNWHKTHPDLGLEHFDFEGILCFEPEKVIDYKIYIYFSLWSKLGYTILLNGNEIDYDCFIFGYAPKKLTVSQSLTLNSLKKFILYQGFLVSEITKANDNGDIITLNQLYDEVDSHIFTRSRTLE